MSGLTHEQIAVARELYAAGGMTPTRIASRMRAQGHAGVTGPQVRAVLTLRSNGKFIDPALRRNVLRLAESGLKPKAISERLDAHYRTVRSILMRAGKNSDQVTKVQWLAGRANRARLYRARRRAAMPITFPEPIVIEVPGWVPDHLHEFYEHTALEDGEEFAAFCVRRLKHGASLAHQ